MAEVYIKTCYNQLINTIINKLIPHNYIQQKEAKSQEESNKELVIGVLRLEYEYEAQIGDIDFPGSFKYKTEQKIVKGLTFAMAQKGTPLTDEIKKDLRRCLEELRKIDNLVGIVGDCGFLLHYQKDVLQINNELCGKEGKKIPVGMSSLILIPTILMTIEAEQQLLVVTANSKSLKPSFKELMEKYCYTYNEKKFVIIGGEDVDGFGVEIQKGDKIVLEKAKPGFDKLVEEELKKEENNIGAILLECTQMPLFGDSLKKKFGLPVWDAITCANFLQCSAAQQFGK